MSKTRPGFSARHLSIGWNSLPEFDGGKWAIGVDVAEIVLRVRAQLAAQMDAGEFGRGLRALGHDYAGLGLGFVAWSAGRMTIVRRLLASGAQPESPTMFHYFAHNCFSFRLELFLMNLPHDRFDNPHSGGGLAARDQALLQSRDAHSYSARHSAHVSRCARNWCVSSRSSNPSAQTTKLSRHSAQFMVVLFC